MIDKIACVILVMGHIFTWRGGVVINLQPVSKKVLIISSISIPKTIMLKIHLKSLCDQMHVKLGYII